MEIIISVITISSEHRVVNVVIFAMSLCALLTWNMKNLQFNKKYFRCIFRIPHFEQKFMNHEK